MKKSLLLLFFTIIALFGIVSPAVSNQTVSADATGKVVFHYQKWDSTYTSAGLWVWGTGTGGTVDAVEKTGVDSFGAYIEVTIGSDATEMGVIPISSDITADTRWSYKDSMLNEAGDDRINLAVDVTAAAAGATMDVYFFSGSDTVFYGSADYANIFVVYFTASEEYESNLGLHAWGGWYQDATLGTWGTWGTPTQIFTGSFLTPEGKLGVVGMAQAITGEEASDANLIVYAGTDNTKKTGDVNAVNKVDGAYLEGGDVNAIYVAGDTFVGLGEVARYAESSFAFKFIPYANINYALSGTYASKPDSILVKFSADVAIAYYDDTQEAIVTEYQNYEIVGYNYVPKANPIVQDDTVYDPYVATAIPDGMARLVVHYQKWDGDYSSVGFWTWGTGSGGTSAPVEKNGVDDFGAVFEFNLGTDATNVGLIPIAKDITLDTRWNYKDSFGGADMGYDVTGITAGEQIDIYFFSGGSTFYTADPEKANVLVLYMNSTGTYEDNLGVHCWGWDQAPAWGTPYAMTQGFATPDGVQGRAVLLTADPASVNNAGLLIYAGDDATKKTGDISGSIYDTPVAGKVYVVYAGVDPVTNGGKEYTFDRASYVNELMNFEKGDAIWDYVTYEEITYPRVLTTITPFFTLTKDGVAVTNPFASIDYNTEKDTATEFVLVLNTALDNTSEYVLSFSNGLEGIALQEASINVNLDTTGPTITFISSDTVSIEAGTGWDSALWPDMVAIDNRDGYVTDRIYVKAGDGRFDLNAVGDHIVTLTVFDDWGNESTAQFTVTVTPAATGCAASSASIIGLGSLGLVLFYVTRKRWL